MKKVWILEKFASSEEMAKSFNEMKAMFEDAKNNNKDMTEEQIHSLEQSLASYEKVMNENPNGRWYGFEGKTIYRQFVILQKLLFAEILMVSSELLKVRLQMMQSIGLVISSSKRMKVLFVT